MLSFFWWIVGNDGATPAIVFQDVNYFVTAFGFQSPYSVAKFKKKTKSKYLKDESMSIIHKRVQILYNVTGYIPQHCLCGIIGSSGAGKTTFLSIIAGIPNVGTVIGRVGASSKKISFVSQVELSLNPMLP